MSTSDRETAKERGAGTPAERLIRFWLDDAPEFDVLAEELIAAGRQGVMDAAARKLEEQCDKEASWDFTDELNYVGESGEFGPTGWAALFAIPVLLKEGDVPDHTSLCESIEKSGVFQASEAVRWAPGWLDGREFATLSPCKLRRVLLDVLNGKFPSDLKAFTQPLTEGGMFGLLGIRLAPPGEDAEIENKDDATIEAEYDARLEASFSSFSLWQREVMPEAFPGILIAMPVTTPSDFVTDVDEHMVEASEEAEDDVNIIDDEEAANYADLMGEIRDFVAMARKETSGERVYCRWRVEADELELVLATQEGGRLDSRTFAVADLPVSPYELVETMSSFVAIIPAISPGSARPTHH